MVSLIHALLAMLASITQHDLARQVVYLRDDGRVLHSRQEPGISSCWSRSFVAFAPHDSTQSEEPFRSKPSGDCLIAPFVLLLEYRGGFRLGIVLS